MRQDQYDRLQALEATLLDVFLAEADPKDWPGAGLTSATMDKATRGDRYWSKRNAAATAVLTNRVATMIGTAQQIGGVLPPAAAPAGDGDDAEGDLEHEIVAAEHEAARLMGKLRKHGKA